MFAVLKTGGKQYKVSSGDVLRVEKLAAEAGDTVQFNDVLMIGGDAPVLGSPTVDGAAVQAEVIDQIKGEKLIHFVKRRRKHGSQRTRGHRQQLTLLRITEILASGGDATGVKTAVGAGSVSGAAVAASDGRYARNRAEQAEMAKRVATGEAPEKTAEAPAPQAESKAEAPKAEAPAPAEAAEDEAIKPDNLLDEARGGAPDDLKKISGVGPKLEKLLNENGVFHFDQIAAWTAEEISYMDDRLSFKGRIARDNWIEQAAKLAAEQE